VQASPRTRIVAIKEGFSFSLDIAPRQADLAPWQAPQGLHHRESQAMSARKAASGNKAKIARRVIEVLDYFDDAHREATVMDIVRRYDRPQSSTSELLSSLVELGLLRKDRHARTYSLTPRAALLGTGGQSAAVRDGRIVRLLDRLSAQTGLPVALFGMTGLSAQIYAWRPATRNGRRDYCRTVDGLQHPLTESAARGVRL
jgi:hypothetical protein